MSAGAALIACSNGPSFTRSHRHALTDTVTCSALLKSAAALASSVGTTFCRSTLAFNFIVTLDVP